MGHFFPPGSESRLGVRIRKRIHWPDWIRIRIRNTVIYTKTRSWITLVLDRALPNICANNFQEKSSGVETAAANSEQQNPPLGINGYKEDSREFDPLTQVITQMLEPFVDGDMYFSGCSSRGWRWPWSSLSIVVTPTWFKHASAWYSGCITSKCYSGKIS